MGQILFEKKGYKGYIILNRPEKLNALTMDMYREIGGILDEIEKDPDIRVVIMKGNGKCFSAGYDLSQEAPNPDFEAFADRKETEEANANRWKIWHSNKVYIAQVHKYCLGGACELVLPCDFIYGDDDLKIGEPEIQFGTFPGFLMIPWVTGLREAKELLLRGAKFSGKKAAEIGLITRSFPMENLEEEVEKLADEMIQLPVNAVALQKMGINRAFEIMGMKQATDNWEDLTMLYHFTETEETRQFNEIVDEKGVKAALAWREELFSDK